MKFPVFKTSSGNLVLVPDLFYSKVLSILASSSFYSTNKYIYYISGNYLYRCPKSGFISESSSEIVVSQESFDTVFTGLMKEV